MNLHKISKNMFLFANYILIRDIFPQINSSFLSFKHKKKILESKFKIIQIFHQPNSNKMILILLKFLIKNVFFTKIFG